MKLVADMTTFNRIIDGQPGRIYEMAKRVSGARR